MSNIKYIIKFKRGETFSVDVIITKKDDFIYKNMVVPATTTAEIAEQFFLEAEIAAINYVFKIEGQENAAN